MDKQLPHFTDSQRYTAMTVFPLLLSSLGLFSFKIQDNQINFDLPFLKIIFIFLFLGYVAFSSFTSSLINLFCTVSGALGLLFIIDLSGISFSGANCIAILIVLSMLLFQNSIFINAVHRNKSSKHVDAFKATRCTIKQTGIAIILSNSITSVILASAFFFNIISQEDEFLLVLWAGLTIAPVYTVLLLPPACAWFLGHINEERLADDTGPSFTEKMTLIIKSRFDSFTYCWFRVMSRMLFSRTAGWVTLFLSVITTLALFISGTWDSSPLGLSSNSPEIAMLSLGVLCLFFFSAARYLSYTLALVPVLTVLPVTMVILAYMSITPPQILSLAVPILSFTVPLYLLVSFTIIDYSLQLMPQFDSESDVVRYCLEQRVRPIFSSILIATVPIILVKFNESFYSYYIVPALVICAGLLLTIIVLCMVLVPLLKIHNFINSPKVKPIKSVYL